MLLSYAEMVLCYTTHLNTLLGNMLLCRLKVLAAYL